MSFILGCDPELLCRRNGKYVSESNYFKNNSSFGLDEGNEIAEPRLGYSESQIGFSGQSRS